MKSIWPLVLRFSTETLWVCFPLYIFFYGPPHFPCLYVYFFSSCLLFGGFPYIFFERGVRIFLLVLFVPFFLNNRGSPPLIRLPSKVCYENKCVFSMLSVSFFIFVFVSFSLFFYVCVFFSCFFFVWIPPKFEWNFFLSVCFLSEPRNYETIDFNSRCRGFMWCTKRNLCGLKSRLNK